MTAESMENETIGVEWDINELGERSKWSTVTGRIIRARSTI